MTFRRTIVAGLLACFLAVGAATTSTSAHGGDLADASSSNVSTTMTDPVFKYATTTPLPHFLDANWFPTNGDPQAKDGIIVCNGATPFGAGLAAVSVAPADFVAFGFLPILINTQFPTLQLTQAFSFDGGGVVAALVTRQIPQLAGVQTYVQFFEVSPIVRSSPGLRFDITN